MEIQEDPNIWASHSSNNNGGGGGTSNGNSNNNNNNNAGNGNGGGGDAATSQSQSINKHVTLLLFRDGDHLNLLRVIDRGDVTSPVSGAIR